MNNENKSQALKVRAMDTVVRIYNQYIKPLLNSAPDVQTSVLDSDCSSSTPTSQIPCEQRPKKSRRDLGDTGFLSTISDIQPVNITESSVDFKFEFKYYELLNYNFSEKNTIYKPLDFYRHFKKEIPILSQVCELIYCVTATSVPSENLFSNAGLVQNEQRNRMEPSALNMVNFIMKNKF
ncbi:zinc finger BED domain-containing 1-like [Brachionus plicatilis]|uniref:Zinc finger BED domain-containing 1-like n=1 Tax=Brachionus plicatilis TaxID=10195 RepID=A0A3M7SKA8_BRAPC|nr:zinc finger BED domain-containing 1-like [Brachionus plicatilis]